MSTKGKPAPRTSPGSFNSYSWKRAMKHSDKARKQCAITGCCAPGTYIMRSNIGAIRYFCVDHVVQLCEPLRPIHCPDCISEAAEQWASTPPS
jgi:hypothetical protein